MEIEDIINDTKCITCNFTQILIEYWWKGTSIAIFGFIMFFIGVIVGRYIPLV